MKKIMFCLLTLLLPLCAHAQSRIYGRISDAEDGAALAHANIYILNSYIGTVSNDSGFYSLEITRTPAVILFSHIGYETRRMEVDSAVTSHHDISLCREVLQYEGIEISADQEDPAMGIMKKVLARKAQRRNALKSFQAKAYTRLRVENDSGIVSIAESVSKLYWDVIEGAAEEILAKHIGKQMPYLTELDVGSKNVLNLSEDNIALLNHTFIGPTHPRALHYYDFELTGERSFDNKIVFDIEVSPKSLLQPLFWGTIAVLDEEFVLVEANLQNSDNVFFSEMINYFQGTYRQQYRNFGGEFWLLIDSRAEERFEVNMGLLSFPRAAVFKISRISNYEINGEIADEVARIRAETADKSGGFKRSETIFEQFQKVPLTKKEAQAFDFPDTTKTLIQSFRPEGLLAPYMIKKEDEIETALRSHLTPTHLTF